MYVRVVLEQGAQSNAIAVPLQAIQRDGSGQAQLYVLKADGTLELLPVRAGRTLDNRQVIEDGLKPGDQVVVEGFQKIRPGAPVQVSQWNRGGTPAAQPGAKPAEPGAQPGAKPAEPAPQPGAKPAEPAPQDKAAGQKS